MKTTKPPKRPKKSAAEATSEAPEKIADDREAAAEWCPIGGLKKWPKNPRKYGPREVEEIAESIRAYGFGRPILARKQTRVIIAGHRTLDAAKLLGLEAVPVRFLECTEEQAELLALADNKTQEKALWDESGLRSLFEIYSADKLQVAGFSPDEINEALGLGELDSADGDEDDESSGAALVEPRVAFGDAWRCGRHVLVCGDSLAEGTLERALAVIGVPVVDMVATDPPFAIYGSSTGVSSSVADDRMVRPFFDAVFRRIAAMTPDGAHVYVFCDWRSYATLWQAVHGVGRFEAKNCIVWDKLSQGLGSNWANQHEFILFAHRAAVQGAMKTSADDRVQTRKVHASNVQPFERARGEERQHNAAKPLPLVSKLLEESSDAGAIVLDMFGGSGTTMIAAEKADRSCVMAEADPGACDKILTRWETITGKMAAKVEA